VVSINGRKNNVFALELAGMNTVLSWFRQTTPLPARM
jgi:hypothetical protein